MPATRLLALQVPPTITLPMEASACGTPVAAFAVGGIPDLARPGITGAALPGAVRGVDRGNPAYSSIVIVRRISSVLNPSAPGIATPGSTATS